MACFNGRDILNEESSYYYSKRTTSITPFSVKLSCAGSGELRCATPPTRRARRSIRQADVYRGRQRQEDVHLREKKWLSILHPEAKVSFKITTNGQEYTFDTRLKIEKAVVDEPFFDHSSLFSFTSGSGGLALPFRAMFPLSAEARFSLSIPGNYPTLMILPSGMGMFSWGLRLRSGERDLEDRRHAGSGAGDQGV